MQLIEENSNFHLIIFNFSFPGFWVWELNCMLQTCISLTYVHILWNVIVFNAFFSLHRAWVVNGVENNNNIESFIHKFSSHGASPHNSFFSLQVRPRWLCEYEKINVKNGHKHTTWHFFSPSFMNLWMKWVNEANNNIRQCSIWYIS